MRQGGLVKETKCEGNSIVLLNLEPETSYDVLVLAGDGTGKTGSFKTFFEGEPHVYITCIRAKSSKMVHTSRRKKAHGVFFKYSTTSSRTETPSILTSVVLEVASETSRPRPLSRDRLWGSRERTICSSHSASTLTARSKWSPWRTNRVEEGSKNENTYASKCS